MDDELLGHIPILDAVDLDILMHKDAHFGGSFDIMIDYYKRDGVGVMPDFDLKRIKELKKIEASFQGSLSESLLPMPAQQAVERSKKLYSELREVYEQEAESLPKAICDLILTEEEYPENEISTLFRYGKAAVHPLIQLLSASDYYDPLFPGYGRAPIFAAMTLEKLQDSAAIPHLFAALGQENFFTDDAIIRALISFGKEAKTFLLKRLTKEPFSKDNVHAITALTTLEDDEEVAKISLGLLSNHPNHQNENFLRYLVFACSGLRHELDRLKFAELKSKHPDLRIKKEMEVIMKNWI
jgi:HEAT repeat protein